jgi:hypothetical protein
VRNSIFDGRPIRTEGPPCSFGCSDRPAPARSSVPTRLDRCARSELMPPDSQPCESEPVEPLLQSDLRPRTSISQWKFRSWGLCRYWAEARSHFTLLTPVRVEEGLPGNIATATRRMRVNTNPDQPGPALVDPKRCWVTNNTAFSNASTQDFQYLACAIPSVGHRWHCSKRFPAVLNGPWGSASVSISGKVHTHSLCAALL